MFSSDKGALIYLSAQKLVSEYDMMDKIKRGVAVAFSGGADSVMLLSFLYELRLRTGVSFPLSAIHVNHCIRGEEADRDEMFCKSFCDSLGVDLVIKRIDVPSLAKEMGKGIEETARHARYSEFSALISGRNDCSYIAVAHNATDNLETVIFNMMRGTGLAGVCGIQPHRDYIIRPLLSVSKRDIETALSKSQIDFVIDSTNLSTEYTRNYIRHEILPRLDHLTSSPELAAFRMTSNLRQDNSFLEGVCFDFLNSSFNEGICDRKELIALHSAILYRVIREMAKRCGSSVENTHVVKICTLLQSGDSFRYSLPNGKEFVCERDICMISDSVRGREAATEYFHPLVIGENFIPEIKARMIISREPITKISSNVYNFSILGNIRSAIIDSELYVRSRKAGDSYRFGKQTRKLKKLFIDKKVPNEIKALIPVICDGSGIVWVPGFGTRDSSECPDGAPLYVALELPSGTPLFDFYGSL